MDEKRKNGYIAGIICSLVAAILLIMTINSGWNQTGQIILVFALLFGLLSIGSLWKPDSIGQIAKQILDNIARNVQEETKSSSSRQSQKSSYKSVQAIATHGGQINISYLDKEKSKKIKEKKRSDLYITNRFSMNWMS